MGLIAKKKICVRCQKLRYIFSKGRCQVCAQIDYVKKSRSKGRPLSKPKTKKPTLMGFYFSIWNKRVQKSYLSGKPLSQFHGTAFFRNMFAHVLEKGEGKFPEFSHEEDNVILLTPDEHTLYDHGTEAQRYNYAKANNCDWSVVYKLEKELLERYNVSYPSNRRFKVRGRSL